MRKVVLVLVLGMFVIGLSSYSLSMGGIKDFLKRSFAPRTHVKIYNGVGTHEWRPTAWGRLKSAFCSAKIHFTKSPETEKNMAVCRNSYEVKENEKYKAFKSAYDKKIVDTSNKYGEIAL